MKSEWNIQAFIMKIGMKYPRHSYENCNEISRHLLWKSEWNIPGIHMRIAQAFIMKIGMKYPRHSYENWNEISRHLLWNRNEISRHLLWKLQWNIPGIQIKIGMKYPGIYYENRNEISRHLLWKLEWNIPGIHYENRNEISRHLLWKSEWNIPGFIWKSQWNIPGIQMKIGMKYPGDYYENPLTKIMKSLSSWNEISCCQWVMSKIGKINEWKAQATRMRYLIIALGIIHDGLQANAWFLS